MGNCRDCRWWEQQDWTRPPSLMICLKVPGVGHSTEVEADEPTFAYCDDSFGNAVVLVTSPDFGCVKFEAKTDA